jgi:hypothetical protein
MRRDLMLRVLRALLAVWFVLTVGEPSVVHICPMHASAAAELADGPFGTAQAAPGRADAADHASGHHAGHGALHHSHAPGHHAHHCTCISSCVGSASLVLAPAGYRFEAPALVAVFEPAALPGDVAALEDPPHLLPPGTGPPRV